MEPWWIRMSFQGRSIGVWLSLIFSRRGIIRKGSERKNSRYFRCMSAKYLLLFRRGLKRRKAERIFIFPNKKRPCIKCKVVLILFFSYLVFVCRECLRMPFFEHFRIFDFNQLHRITLQSYSTTLVVVSATTLDLQNYPLKHSELKSI